MAEAMPLRKRNPEQALLLLNIPQLLTLRPSTLRRGPELKELGILEDAAVLCAGGKIVSVGRTRDALRDPWVRKHRRRIREYDCAGKLVLPGFVDSHTHLVFAAPRLVDFEKRIAGASYEEIAAAGGGIRSSVDAVRKASVSALAAGATRALFEMSAQGTTTVEAKSGYGLNTAAELKSLEAIRTAAARWPGAVVPTLLGAHAAPKEHLAEPERYLREVTGKMIPQAARRKLASFVDVYCDRGAFTLAQAEQVFAAARRHGLGVRAHLGQLSATPAWPLLEYGPASLDHMDNILDEDLPQLERHNVVVTLLPASNYFLGLGRYPDARRLLDAGVAVALATDYNPGTAPTLSMPFVLSLACTQMRMTPAEAIAAATINGAHALRLAHHKGSVEPGKDADLAIFDLADYRELPYWMASCRCAATVLNGVLTEAPACTSIP